MKERAIRKTLQERRQELAKKQAIAEANAKKAFAVEEISKANADYVNATFSAMTNADKYDIAQKAHLTYQNALKKHGFDESDFESKSVCSKCEDTGNDNGKVCSCIWSRYIENLKIECEIDKRAPFSFDDCEPSRIKDDEQRHVIESVYESMKKYAERFPSSKCTSIVLSGSVGTGKTCLASAIARAVVEKGYSAKLLSAYEFNSLMLTTHTSPISERNALMHDVLTADLLVIDDLGTEPMLKNVTVEYLLLTIEERQLNGLATIITTNLSIDSILSRYGERIYSRLSHKQHSLIIEMKGNDLRIN